MEEAIYVILNVQFDFALEVWFGIHYFGRTVIHSMSKFFTTNDFHDDFFICNYH